MGKEEKKERTGENEIRFRGSNHQPPPRRKKTKRGREENIK